jgi:hypothetical protein
MDFDIRCDKCKLSKAALNVDTILMASVIQKLVFQFKDTISI